MSSARGHNLPQPCAAACRGSMLRRGSFRAITDEVTRADFAVVPARDRRARRHDVHQPCPHFAAGQNAEEHPRLINAMYPAGEPVAGQALKIVE